MILYWTLGRWDFHHIKFKENKIQNKELKQKTNKSIQLWVWDHIQMKMSDLIIKLLLEEGNFFVLVPVECDLLARRNILICQQSVFSSVKWVYAVDARMG